MQEIKIHKAAFSFMRIFYPPHFVRTVFVRVTNSDQTIFNVGVCFLCGFYMIIHSVKS